MREEPEEWQSAELFEKRIICLFHHLSVSYQSWLKMFLASRLREYMDFGYIYNQKIMLLLLCFSAFSIANGKCSSLGNIVPSKKNTMAIAKLDSLDLMSQVTY